MNIPKYSKLFIQIVLETSVRESECPGNVRYTSSMDDPSVRQMNPRLRTATVLQNIDKSSYLGNGSTCHHEI